MSNTEIEKRLILLEKEVALLKEKTGQEIVTKKPWWEERMGMFADDPVYDEAMRLGREYRKWHKERIMTKMMRTKKVNNNS